MVRNKQEIERKDTRCPAGDKLYENFYGTAEGNNAGEWITYDRDTGDIMVYTDSDTTYGFGFLKLSPV